MRLGDSITITQAEVQVLESPAFQKFAPADLTSRVLLTPSGEAGYYRLSLPRVGKQMIEALFAFAASGVDSDEASIAEGLAEAIARRISPES